MADDEPKRPRNTEKSAPPDIPPPIVSRYPAGDGNQWVRLALYAVIALLVVGVVVLGGTWLANRNDNEEKQPAKPATTATTTTPKSVKSSTKQPAKKSSSASSSSSSNSATSTSTGTSSNQPSKQPTTGASSETEQAKKQQSSELANTGPGSVAAVFASTAILMSGLHYVYQLRRAKY